MATPKEPQDRKAKDEARGRDVTFTYGGVEYVIDRGNADNLELMEFVEDEQYIRAIRGYLGPDQWAKWKASVRDEKGRVPTDGFEPFMQAVMDAIGGKGNSSASSGS